MLDWDSVFKVEHVRIQVIVDEQDVFKFETVTFQDCQVFEDQLPSLLIHDLASVLLVPSMLEKDTVWVKIVNNWVSKPVFSSSEDCNFEIFVGKFKTLFKVWSDRKLNPLLTACERIRNFESNIRHVIFGIRSFVVISLNMH